jgi:hypothetical protein
LSLAFLCHVEDHRHHQKNSDADRDWNKPTFQKLERTCDKEGGVKLVLIVVGTADQIGAILF